jgi:hypothetical protein
MYKKFLDGLIFGAGFTVAFLIFSYTADFFIAPSLLDQKLQRIAGFPRETSNVPLAHIDGSGKTEKTNEKPFHELAPEEQIKQANFIALAKYEKSPNGKMRAIIKEFLKKDANTPIYYKIGDEYPGSSFYPEKNTSYGDGVVIFFTGSPATMKMSMTYSGNRISSLGDMPMELFLKKCKEPNA